MNAKQRRTERRYNSKFKYTVKVMMPDVIAGGTRFHHDASVYHSRICNWLTLNKITEYKVTNLFQWSFTKEGHAVMFKLKWA